MNFKNIYIYNILVFVFLFSLLLYFLISIFSLLVIVLLPIGLKSIFTWAEKDFIYQNADIYYDKIHNMDYFRNFHIPLILSVFIVATILKIIHTKSEKVEYIEEEKKYDFIENGKKEILRILELNKLYITPSTTVVIGKKIYISMLDLKSFIKKRNANGLFIIYHELHHIKSGDTTIGYYTLILNQILSILLIFLLGYFFLIFMQNMIMKLDMFLELSDNLKILIREVILTILIGYLFYKFFYFNKYISKFKECLADRTAHILVYSQSLIYSNDIFNHVSNIKHPKKIDRISCTQGKSNLLEKVIIYYGVIELLSIFPSFINEILIYYIFFIHLNYLLIIFIILRLNINIIHSQIIQYFLIFYPILLWIKLQIIVLLSINFFNDVLINMEQSQWLKMISFNINTITIIITVLTYGYLIYEKITKNI